MFQVSAYGFIDWSMVNQLDLYFNQKTLDDREFYISENYWHIESLLLQDPGIINLLKVILNFQ